MYASLNTSLYVADEFCPPKSLNTSLYASVKNI